MEPTPPSQPLYPSPQQPPYPPYPYSQPMQQPLAQPPKKNRRTLWIVLGSIGGVLLLCCVITGIAAAIGSNKNGNATATNTVGSQQAAAHGPTATPRNTPLPSATAKPTAQVSHFPPKTHADLQWLAARGNASALTVYSSEKVGLVGVCPELRVEVFVDPSVTGEQLAEDLLAYFYGSEADGVALNNPCGSVVFAYHNKSEEAGGLYTAGRINLDVNTSNGQGNIDPNATNLTYAVTLDIGGALNPQEEIITYQ